ICGAGSIGSGVIDLLLALGKRLVVVELNPDATIVERAREQHFDLLTGDASRDTTLDLCNLAAAHGLIALTNVDTLNLEIALGARARNPIMPIVLRIAEASFAESIARHFEFETTFSAAALAAPAFVGLARFAGSRGRGSFGGQELARDGRVIGGAVLRPRLLVDAAGGNPVGRMRRHQQMIDAQPLVAVPTPGLVIPEGIAVRLAVKDAVSVGQPEVKESAKPRARFHPTQSIVAKRHRVVNIIVRRADVVVAGQHERDLTTQQFARVPDQPLHPAKLVGEFVGTDRISVRQVDRGDADLAERRLDVTRLLVFVIAEQSGHDLLRGASRK